MFSAYSRVESSRVESSRVPLGEVEGRRKREEGELSSNHSAKLWKWRSVFLFATVE